MKSHFHFAIALCFSLVGAAIASAHAAEIFQLGDLRKLVSLSDARISPDGKQVAVIVSTPDWKSNKDRKSIELIDVASGAQRALTWHRTGIGSPRWSPDGSRLAFIAKDTLPALDSGSPDKDDKSDDDSEKPQTQIFVMSMHGGDPIRVTHTKHGVESFAWSPDGQRIAFIAPDPPVNEKAIKAHDDVFEVTDNHFLTRAALSSWHLWVVSSNGGKPQRLTQGEFSLQTDQQDSPEPAWSHDGKTIAFTRFPGPYWGPSFHSVIDTVDASGATPHTLVSAETSANFTYAPHGNSYAFMRPRNGDQNNGNAIYIGGHASDIDVTAALARNINAYAWLPNAKALLLAGAEGTQTVFWSQPLHGSARKLALGDVQASSDFSVANTGTIAFVGSTPTHPAELYVMDSANAKPHRLTNLNAFVDGLNLAKTETVRWKGPGGFDEDGVLLYPPNFRKGTKYPLVLIIHGGPESASTIAFSPLSQLMAAAGFVVFQPNYRGSTNLGDAYQHAIYRDTGDGPGKDVMAGLAVVEKLGIVDTARIGVSGWSYGGYMTAWLTGHYDVWKAAVSGAALTDWVMDYTVAFYQKGDLYFFGGSPWTAKYHDIWREQSPIAYAHKVTAPTLIMGDVGDPNVPLINSYEWYHALRDNGVPVKFFAYPADTHFPHDIVRTTDVYKRWIDWMTVHLKPQP
ncbi:MAG TPA: S9 family peptidase [Rudaea sp.]|nr:S9 family peptidase [Rudaea sp.]